MSVLEKTLIKIYPQSNAARKAAIAHIEQLTMPHWALGDLLDLAVDIAGMMDNPRAQINKKLIACMAADHGVAAEGVSKYPAEVTVQMALNVINGGAGVNALASQSRTDVKVYDFGIAGDMTEVEKSGKLINKKVGNGTDNMVAGPAMSRTMAQKSVENGIAVAEENSDYDIFGTGELGIGNTTASSAIATVLTGRPAAKFCGRGSGLDDEQLAHKIRIVERAIAINSPRKKDALDVLSKVGGFEIGGIAGLIIGAASQHKPVVVDGFISTAGAMIAAVIEPFTKDYMIFSHGSVEPGHAEMLKFLGCNKPLLDLKLRLGEGSGAAMAMNLVEGGLAILNQMATFEEAAVSGADK
ncbi:nicotinate-nucleotide--dimethylbenzimidazole phosphoribosyltransferase [Desulforhopalus vacuolatus]|uniref:nicotinate-nucleotide--dimethylbenzimidazole phosphoribosyltransferase n=1 Tax=Desulforhopalus vacuolatus TaxID=40414 RepID=UPI001962A8C9|nr:nicotinate-nucleotide--dimethylbenzimidazole phosphoribosyltransferase [Desulforhopalus vacuolatus]MBM9518978.1 nicotinate-nucleotide--dimethylbenzimidazole phosphoribosyltransferase [Desulforhopalus vacuolatus]